MLNSIQHTDSDRTTLRDHLESEVEQYLNSGGAITSLPMGYSENPNGLIPRATNQVFKESQPQAASQRPPIEQKKVVRAAKKPKPRPARPSQSDGRRAIAIARKKAAVDAGLKEYVAPCIHHGEAVFKIFKKLGRCTLCDAERRQQTMSKTEKNDEQLKKIARHTINRAAMAEAAANNLIDFTGECVNCGITMMRIKRCIFASGKEGCSYNCIQCANKSYKTYAQQKAAKRKAALAATKKNVGAASS